MKTTPVMRLKVTWYNYTPILDYLIGLQLYSDHPMICGEGRVGY